MLVVPGAGGEIVGDAGANEPPNHCHRTRGPGFAEGIGQTSAGFVGFVNAPYDFVLPTWKRAIVDDPRADGFPPGPPEHFYSRYQPSEIEQGVDGLRPPTTYHLRLVATSEGAVTYGKDEPFRTLPAERPPLADRGAVEDGRAEDDPGLGAGGAGVAADCADRVVEVVGVAAGDAKLEVEAAGEEGDFADRVEAGDALLEVGGVGGGEETDVDEGIERAADAGRVDACCVAADHTVALESAHAVGGAVRAEPDLLADRGEGCPSVCGEDAEDSVVDLVHGCGIEEITSSCLRKLGPRRTIAGVPTGVGFPPMDLRRRRR